VIAALPDLEVGAAGERDLYADQGFVRRQARDVDILDAQILAAIEDGSGHVAAGFV